MKKKVLFALIALFSFVGAWADNVVKIGDTEYATFQEAWNIAKAVTDGSTTTITVLGGVADIGSAGGRLLGNKVILDLNGQEVTGKILYMEGDLTITNGTLKAATETVRAVGELDATSTKKTILTIAADATIVATGDTDGNANAVCLIPNGNYSDNNGVCVGVEITIDGTVMTQTTSSAQTSAAVFVHGLINNESSTGNVININGTVTSNEDAGVAIHGRATVNVNDGATVSGYTGICVKAGTLNVADGATVAGTGAANPTPADNGNGTEMTGAAVSVTSTYAANNGPIKVNIAGGTFSSSNDNIFVYQQPDKPFGDNNPAIAVTGGEFSDDSAEDFLADGFYFDDGEVKAYDWKLTQSSLPYNSEDQMDALEALIKLIPANPNQRFTFTVKMGETAEGTAVNEVKNVGSYFVQVYMGEQEIGTGKIFKITAYNLTIGSSVTYKQIGDPDPAPEYGLMYDNNVSTEAANLIIKGLKLVRKYAPSLGRVSTADDDYVGAQWDYYIDIRDAQIVDANNEVNPNYAISSASVEGTLEVTKKYLRPGEFRVLVDAEYVYDGTAKEPAASAITVEQDKNYDKRGTAEYTADWKAVDLSNFAISYKNNIAADAYGTNSGTVAEPVYAWKTAELVINKDADLLITDANRAIVILTPTADGIYTSRLALGNNKFLPANEADQVKQIAGDFKIKQRDINDATIAAIPAKIFNNNAFTPEPAVTYANGSADGLTLVKNTDFTYAYDKNTYVGTADVKVEAVFEGETTKTYTGNWFNAKTANFTINPYEFTLQPADNEKTLGDADPNPLTTLTAVPSADMKDGDTPLPFPVDDVTSLLKEGWAITRAAGEFVAVYDINVTGAELKASTPAEVSDPAHNYVMEVGEGTFEIKYASDYYVSSKYVTREFRSQDATIPFIDDKNNTDGNAFYLYKRVVDGQTVTYEQIAETADIYQEIKESGRITGNQLVGQTIDGSVQAVLNNNQIEPVIDNGTEGQYEYTIARLPREAFQHTTGDYANTPEGICYIIPRKVTIMADNQTSAYGEAYVTPLTYKVYDGHVTRDQVTAETPVSNVHLNTNNQYAPNTIANFNSLTCAIETAVNDAEKPLKANVTADIVVSTAASNGGTLAGRNPNYDIQFVNGTYTVTPSTNLYFVDVQLNKDYDGTTGNWEKTVTWTFGTSKETATAIEGDKPITDEEIRVDWTKREGGEPTEVGTTELTSTMITRPDGGNVIGGYPVNYGGSAIISKGGEVIIAVKTLGANYPVDPSLAFVAKRVTITGATFDEIAANGEFSLAYTKPEVGFIKKGAPVQVKFNGKAYGTPEGEVVSADDWAWVANYTSVTVKSGSVKVTAPEDITLDIVAFNKASYTGAGLALDAEINDELIRDYAGTEVNSVTITCSEQEYKVKADQWYTMVLPFTATVREIQTLFNGFVGVDQLKKEHSASKASEIRFGYTTKDIPANNPFLAKTDKEFTFVEKTIARDGEKIMIDYPENADGTAGEIAIEDANHNKVIGTYNAFVADNASDYVYIQLSDGEFHPMSVGTYVRPLGAYIQVAEGVANNQAPVRIVIEEADGTETVINGVDAEAEVAYGEGWYTISGVKLEGEPTTSGTYIFNGKKVFIQK